MPIAELDGIEIYYRVSGEGERVVFTHGSWTDGDTWQALTPHLTDRFEVVVWDRRGHTRSGDGTGQGSFREDAADLAALIEHLGGAPVHAVGNSAGGTVVLNLMVARPDLLVSATVHEPEVLALLAERHPGLLAEEQAMLEEVERLFEAGEPEEAVKYFVSRVVGPGAWEMFPGELRGILVSNALTFLDEMGAPLEESVDWDGLRVVETPILVTTGTNTPEAISRAAEELVRQYGMPLRRIPGADHLPHRSQPEAYAGLLHEFFSSVSLPRRPAG